MIEFSGVKTWEFLPSGRSRATVLWRSDRSIKDNRRMLVGNYFTVSSVTQSDNGKYSLKDRNGLVLSTSELEVVGE